MILISRRVRRKLQENAERQAQTEVNAEILALLRELVAAERRRTADYNNGIVRW